MNIKMKKLFLHSTTVLIALLSAVSVIAAPVEGPMDDSFYTPPIPLPEGDHGDLIWYRQASATPPGAIASDTWNVLYHSTDGVGEPNVVTGTVLIPQGAWAGSGERPVIAYAVGTHGLCHDCAPSVQLENGTDYENANIAAALREGYAVVITDNPGYTNSDMPSYMVGIAQGHAVLDIIEAAKQIPSIPLSQDAKIAVWGYSQGGQTAAWAGQLQPEYMPDIDLAGVAAGGVPADLIEVGNYGDGKVGSSFLLQVVIGLWSQYPDDVPLEELANPAGLAAIESVTGSCVFESLFEYMHVSISELVIGNPSLEELINTYAHDQLVRQNLGDMPIAAPVLLYHGTADEFIPLETGLQLKEKYCSRGVNTTFLSFPGEHIITQFQAASYVLSWLQDRFENKWTGEGTCITQNPRPVADHNPLEGDFIVSLNEWPLKASVHLATLDQDVIMPEESTFSADTNMTTNEISGRLFVPTFKSPIKVAGIPLKVKLDIIPVENMTGTASLDDLGYLHVHGHAYTTIAVSGVGLTSLTAIPINLHTEEPVDFQIDFDGPISSLGNGNLIFTGTTTFPPMTGGLFKNLFTTLMSGPGQTYMYNVSPLEPKKW